MAELKELLEMDELNDVWNTSQEKPVLLFKQSTTCPISAEAFSEYHTFLNENTDDIGAYYVKVRESRPVSDQIAEELDVHHQSPQIFLVKNRQQVWNASHDSITADNINAAIANI